MAKKTPPKKTPKPTAPSGPKNPRPEEVVAATRPLWIRLVRWGAVVSIWGVVAVGVIVAWHAFGLPNLDALETPERRPSVTLLAADKSVLATYGDLHGGAIRFNEAPPFLIQAIVATEDRRFFEHGGVDFFGIARALVTNLLAGGVRQGGSTLTQQLAKNLFLTPERSYSRKIRELILAFWLEARFSKEQLFTIYLNRVYLGAGTYGVEAAARRYFGKSTRRLNLREASVIAGLLKAPSRYSPLRDPKAAIKRGDQVLANMVAAGFLSQRDADAAKRTRLRAIGRRSGSGARYFADWLLERAAGFVGRTDRDLVIGTTLSPRLQRFAEQRIEQTLAGPGARRNVGQAALLSLAPDGAVRAMVGGRRYQTSQFNRATQAQRQPGSAFKLFVYLAALEAGMTPDDMVLDAPVTIAGWRPRNYDGRYRGRLTLAAALAGSVNTAAVRVSEKVGRRKVVALAERLGITSRLKAHPSIALGASEVSLLEMTAAYAVIANHGLAAWPYGITEIRDGEGKLLYRRSANSAGRLLDAKTVARMQIMLKGVIDQGTGKAAKLSRPAAGKTGTSQDFRDAWFIGFTNELVTGVWLGNDDSSPTKRVTGGSLPAVLWRRYMTDALKGAPPRPLMTK
jgi:penicillin-binding protein 1A